MGLELISFKEKNVFKAMPEEFYPVDLTADLETKDSI